MLSPTDVHYLVGLLTMISNPESVEIVLGDIVHDDIADKGRDVDITVTYKDVNGQISAFKGIEVKKHSRPLDVTHIEQLSAKLNDMSKVSHRRIVSASGYTEPARKKAESKGVDLFEFIRWNNPMEGFGHVSFPPNFTIKQSTLMWVGNPSVAFNPKENIPDEIKNQITGDSRICGFTGDKDNNHKTFQQLADELSSNVIATIKDREEIKSLTPGTEKHVKYLFNMMDGVYVVLKDSKLYLKQALLQGKVTWKEQIILPEFKLLIKVGESTPYVGCAIAELSQGNLIGITVSQVDRTIKLINIPLSDRNQKKIQLLKLR